MTWTRMGAVVAVVLIGGAYLVGHLPERRLRTAAEAEVGALRQQLAAAEARVRMGQLLGQSLTVREVVIRQNYGQAQELSSALFDTIRAEAAATPVSGFREVLEEALSRRDAITAALTRADPAVAGMLHGIEVRMRGALGYPLPPEPPR